jgi:hypothetical protein
MGGVKSGRVTGRGAHQPTKTALCAMSISSCLYMIGNVDIHIPAASIGPVHYHAGMQHLQAALNA